MKEEGTIRSMISELRGISTGKHYPNSTESQRNMALLLSLTLLWVLDNNKCAMPPHKLVFIEE